MAAAAHARRARARTAGRRAPVRAAARRNDAAGAEARNDTGAERAAIVSEEAGMRGRGAREARRYLRADPIGGRWLCAQQIFVIQFRDESQTPKRGEGPERK